MRPFPTPNPHQHVGALWLAERRRALLADTMRVGKTGTSILAADMIGAHSILVVAPGIARQNWAREYGLWSLYGRPVAVVTDVKDRIEPNGVTIVSGDSSRNADLHARIMANRWDVLKVDEAQDYKEPASQRARRVLSARGFAARADRIWFLTGTPLLNHPAELWVMLATIGVFKGAYLDFLNRFCSWFAGDHGPVVRGMRNIDELKALLAPVMLRRTFREVYPDTPEPTWSDVTLDPSTALPEHLAALDEIDREAALGAKLRGLVARIMRGEDVDLSREAGGMARLRSATALAKAGPTVAWVREQLRTGAFRKLVIFGHHTAPLLHMTRELAEFGAAAIHGGVPMPDRQPRIDAFTRDPARRVLVCQDQVARTAIDLTAASDLLFAEMDWVSENNAQVAMRVQGPRQTRPVRLWTARLPGSSDDGLVQVLAKKSKMAASLYG